MFMKIEPALRLCSMKRRGLGVHEKCSLTSEDNSSAEGERRVIKVHSRNQGIEVILSNSSFCFRLLIVPGYIRFSGTHPLPRTVLMGIRSADVVAAG